MSLRLKAVHPHLTTSQYGLGHRTLAALYVAGYQPELANMVTHNVVGNG
ncbi:hypothetical protein [Shewanella sp.]